MKTKFQNVLLAEREMNILFFLWRWKWATTAALISKRFFDKASAPTAYQRLMKLKKAGLIDIKGSNLNNAWTLTTRGFDTIRNQLPVLKEEGFRSENFEHDCLVTAFHLGEWLYDEPEYVQLFSEQELRRIHRAEYPDWVPRCDMHRPDGYTLVRLGEQKRCVAIEVEISRKLPSAYVDLAEAYDHQENIDRVLWLVPGKSDIRRIETAVERYNFSKKNKHNFVLLDDFKKQGWLAQIRSGPEQTQTVYEFTSLKVPNLSLNSSLNSRTHLLLDGKKSYQRSTSSKIAAN